MLNGGTVNGRGSRIIPRQNARFSAISPGNLCFEKSVKYISGCRINYNPALGGKRIQYRGLSAAEVDQMQVFRFGAATKF
jgi:hypothetical protein